MQRFGSVRFAVADRKDNVENSIQAVGRRRQPPREPRPERARPHQGGFLLAAVLLFAGDADSQTVPAEGFSNSDITVSRTNFGEDAGRLDPRSTFFISREGWNTGRTYYIYASLESGTGQSGAVKGTDFTELENLRTGDTWWIQNVQSGGGSTTSITFSLLEDQLVEGTETFTLRARGATTANQLAQTNPAFDFDHRVEMKIQDNDTAPTLTASFDVSSVDENVTGGRAEFLLSMTGTQPGGTQVQYEINTVDGTATAGQDYVALSQNNLSSTLQGWTSGSGVGSVFITITDDQDVEGPETFTIRVTSRNSSVLASEHVVTINDDERPAGPGPAANQPILAENANHLITQSEALLEAQPRLTDYARNTGIGAYDFTLRACSQGLESLDGGVSGEGFWGQATFSRSGSRGADGEHVVASLGGHREVSGIMLIGGMLQFDRAVTKPVDGGRSGEFTSEGWMAGPYVVARDPSSSLFLEGRLLYGQASHRAAAVDPGDGAKNGKFGSERWLAHARIEGEYALGDGMILYPLADLSHARNAGDGFEETGGTDLDVAVRTSVSKLRLGADFEIPLDSAKGDLIFRPGLKLVVADRKGVAFGKSDLATSGRVDLGIDYQMEDSVSIGFQGYYSGGGGESEFESYGAGLRLRMEF